MVIGCSENGKWEWEWEWYGSVLSWKLIKDQEANWLLLSMYSFFLCVDL